MGARGSKKAYTRARTGMYLHTKFGCDRSLMVGCRPSDDRQTNKQTSKHPNIQTSGNDNKAHSLRDVTQKSSNITGSVCSDVAKEKCLLYNICSKCICYIAFSDNQRTFCIGLESYIHITTLTVDSSGSLCIKSSHYYL